MGVPNDPFSCSAEQIMFQPRTTVGGNHDQVALGFRRGVHDFRVWYADSNLAFDIFHSLGLIPAP